MAIARSRYVEPVAPRSGQSLKNWIRRQLAKEPFIQRKDLLRRARDARYLPLDARGSQWLCETLYYLRDRGEVEIRCGHVRALSLACRRNTSDAFSLKRLTRQRLRGRQEVSRALLRAELRADRLLSWGTRGGRRLQEVLADLARSGEIAITGDTIIPLALQPDAQRRKLCRPPSARAKKRLGRERRERKAAQRSGGSTIAD